MSIFLLNRDLSIKNESLFNFIDSFLSHINYFSKKNELGTRIYYRPISPFTINDFKKKTTTIFILKNDFIQDLKNKNLLYYRKQGAIRFYSLNENIHISNKKMTCSRKILGFTKKNINNIYFDFYNMDFDKFKDELVVSNLIKPNIHYAFLIKIKREDEGIGMGSKHIPFLANEENFEYKFYQLYKDIVEVINIFISEYNDCEILYVMLMFIQMATFQDLKLKNINNIKLNKDFDKISLSKRNFNSFILPLTEQTFYYGKKLERQFENGKLIKVMIDDNNFIDLIKETSLFLKDNINHLNIQFFLYTNIKKQQYVIVTNGAMKEVFTLSGLKIIVAYDETNTDNRSIFKRKIGNTSITIDSSQSKSDNIRPNRVLSYEVEYKFTTIQSRENRVINANVNLGKPIVEQAKEPHK